MRKLSKKISMLMVLAMIVSLFSGVVSASAASKWSFYDRTADEVVERNATYVMEKDQYANFDLYYEGEEADADTYSYTWYSSDEDVVYVDSTNGRLRADKYGKAEAGDKAFVYVLIDNKTTEKNENAKRGFYIEIAADEVVEPTPTEAPVEVEYAIVSNISEETYLTGEKYELEAVVTADGEEIDAEVAFSIDGVAITEFAPTKADTYTIVATATIDGEEYVAEFEVVVEESVPEIVEAKQVSLTAVEITFNNDTWAAKAVADQAITVAQVISGIEVAELVKSIEAKKDAADTVVVTLYNNIAKDATYKFAFADYECATTVKGAGDTPAYIMVVEGKAAVNVTKMASVKIYNAANIDITSLLPNASVSYSLVGENYDVDVQADGAIYFFEAGKQAVIKAVLDMGWDSEGNEIKDLEDTGVYTSVPAQTETGILGYALSIAGKGMGDLTYTKGTLKLSLSDTGRYLYAKYEVIPFEADKYAQYISNEVTGYTYHSTNESVLLVEADGQLKPCKEGYANVYIKKGDNVVGSINIKVEGGRKLSVFTASNTDKKLATAIADDSIEIAVTTKDQFQEAYANVKYEIALDSKVNGFDGATIGTFFDVDTSKAISDGKIKLTLNDGAKLLDEGAVQTLAFTVKAIDKADTNNAKTQRLSVTVRNNDGLAVKTSTLEVSADEIDLALNKKSLNDYKATIKLVNVDDKSYDLGVEQDIALESVATTGSAYSVVITKVGDSNWKVTDNSKYITITGGVITINPVLDVDDKLATGNYKIQLYKKQAGDKMQVIKNDTIVIKDSTPAITAKVVKTDTADMKAALEFYINGAKVDAKYIESVVANDDAVSVGTKQFVKTVTLTINSDALNKDSDLNMSIVKKVDVNQLFTY